MSGVGFNRSNPDYSTMKQRFDQTKNNQGWVGRLWDGAKENLGTSSKAANGHDRSWYNPKRLWSNVVDYDRSSEAVEQSLNDLKNGKASANRVAKQVDQYQASPENGVNAIADIAAGATAVGTVAGVTLATGGVGLPAAIGIGATAGAAAKAGLKASDTIGTDQSYSVDAAAYDAVTGGVIGASGPVAGKMLTVGRALGTSAFSSFVAQETTAGATAGLAVGSMVGGTESAAKTLYQGGTVADAAKNGVKGAAIGGAIGTVTGGTMGAVSARLGSKVNTVGRLKGPAQVKQSMHTPNPWVHVESQPRSNLIKNLFKGGKYSMSSEASVSHSNESP